MANIRQIQEQRQQLALAQQQAEKVASEKIPERRFGGQVTKQTQQDVISRRQQAQQAIGEIKNQQEKLNEYERQLQEQEAAQRAYEQAVREQQEYEAGRQASISGNYAQAPYLRQMSQAYREGWASGIAVNSAFEERKKIAEQKKAFTEQGLKPVTDASGNIVGFEDMQKQMSYKIDAITKFATESPEQKARYEKAGIIFKTQETLPTNGISISGMVSGKSNILSSNAVSSIQNNSNIVEAFKTQNIFEKGKSYLARETIRTGTFGYLAGFASAGLGTAEAFYLKGKQIITNPTQASIEFITLKGPRTLIKGTYTTGKLFVTGRANEIFGDIGQSIQGTDTGFILGKGSEKLTELYLGNVALVKVPIIAESALARLSFKYRKVEQIPFKAGLTENVIKNIPKIEEISLIPPGKPYTYGIDTTKLPPSLRGGFGYSAEELQMFKGQKGITTSQRDLLIKSEAQLMETEPGIGLFGTPREPVTGKLTTRLSRLGESPSPVSLKELFYGDFTIGFGGGKPQILVFPQEVVGDTFKLAPKLPSTELEVATLSPKLGGPATLFKKDLLAVTTIGKKGRTSLFNLGRKVEITEVSFGKVKGVDAKSALNKLNKGLTPTKKELEALSKQTGFESSDYLGSKPTVSPFSLVPRYTTSQKIKTTKTTSIKILGKATLSIIKSPKITPIRNTFYDKEIKRLITPTINTPSMPIITPRMTIEIKTPRKPTPPVVPNIFTPIYNHPRKSIFPFTTPRISNRRKEKSSFAQAFRTFFKKGKKKVYLPGLRTRGRALEYGQRFTLSNLRATFGIEKARGTAYGLDINYTPSSKIFRSYKIQKGKKIPLMNMFIQKTRQEGGLRGGRLAFRGERKEIQRSRLMKGGLL